MTLQIGDKAPEFSLYDSGKNLVSLSDYYGKKNVLILFFPLAFTSVCTKELCAIRDDIGRYENEQVQVLGISVDSVYSLAKYKEEQHYNYPLLSDFNKEVSAIYGVLNQSFSRMDMHGVSRRSAFIGDKRGILQYVEILENDGLVPDFMAINEKIASLA